MTITFIVYGESRPASFSFGRGVSKKGKPFMYRSVKHKKWMEEIAKQALQHKPDKLMVGAIALSLAFWRRKPSSAGKDWRKAKSPERAAKAAWPVSKPDIASLERPVADALKGIMYRDDSQIVMTHSVKIYAADDEPERVGISIEELHPGADADATWLAHFIKSQEQEDPWDAAAKALG